MKEIQLSAEDVEGLEWEPVERGPEYGRDRAVFGRAPDGSPVYVYRKWIAVEDEFLEANARQRNESDGQRWASDKDGVPLTKIGSVPLNVFYRDFAGRADDQDFKKWWWSRDKNQVFRTRRGNL